MLATTTLGHCFDDEDQFDYQLRAHTVDGEPPGYLYDLGSEWAFQPIIDGQRSTVVRTIPAGEVEGWVVRNRVRERVCSQMGLPLSVLGQRG